MTSSAIAQRGKGVLRAFNDAGVCSAADVHVALRLSRLGGETSEAVLLAVALAVRAVRSGSVCLDMNRFRDVTVEDRVVGLDTGDHTDVDPAALPWPETEDVLAALQSSPLVIGGDRGPLRPLRLVETEEGPLLYLDRYFLQENMIRTVLDERAATRPVVDLPAITSELAVRFPDPAPDRQRIAAAVAATTWTTVIAGGPGTGKTHTVARILAILVAQQGQSVRIGLAAPTGKAAARLQESVAEQAAELGLPAGLTSMTLHRLLGWQPGSRSRFKYDSKNRLPYDVVVIDETSMVSLTMMSRLLEAVRPDARLLLVGDPDQLTSVDAGAVLADLVARPVHTALNADLSTLVRVDLDASDDPDEKALGGTERDRLRGGVVRLTRGRRFGGDIADLAVAVRDGNADAVMAILTSGSSMVTFHDPGDIDAVRRDVVDTAADVTASALIGDSAAALAGLERHRLLCAHRDGPFGVERWARSAMDWVGEAQGTTLDPAQWYPGQPLLVTANDHETRIYNGDTGVIVETGGAEGSALMAAFARGNEPFLLHPSQLAAVHTVYAMTIHRSQGSQYDSVSVVLPDEASSLLTRELLYTAITRARGHVRIIGTEESVRAGVDRRVLRASGLRRTIQE